jgi:HD-like signal output (HDOD) protein
MEDTMNEIIKEKLNKAIADKTLKLPSLPDIILRVNSALSDDGKSVLDISKIIQNDVSLSARLLQIANSPAIRGAREISSIKDAISRLGIDLVKNIAICVAIRDKFKSKNPKFTNMLTKILDDSIRSSVYCYIISKSVVINKDIKPEISLIVGLLHNIGSLPVIGFISESKEYQGMDLDKITNAINEVGPYIGEKILTLWDFQVNIVKSIYTTEIHCINAPVTYGDIFELANAYHDVKNGEIRYDLDSSVFDKIESAMEESKEEIKSLISLFSS